MADRSSAGRRSFLRRVAAVGVGSAAIPRTLWARMLGKAEIDASTVQCAEELSGVRFTDEQRELMLQDLEQNLTSYRSIREQGVPYDVGPAIQFSVGDTAPADISEGGDTVATPSLSLPTPSTPDALAFLSVSELAQLLAAREVSSEELTRLYLARLERYDPVLHALVTPTTDRAIRLARVADDEIGSGNYRGPLHGIPWGAKDLLDVDGYPTTWGTEPFRDRSFTGDAEVVRRLDRSGAVLIAKLSLGELAWGDVWYGGMTRNPWNPEQGSSGSSAGPGAATAAGLVGFSIGSETYGSISSPSTRNGVTGLRPTFGRVPRTGAMALSWSLDKLGPMCRSAADCALVFHAIHGADGIDTKVPRGFAWDPALDPRSLRVGYVREAFEDRPDTEQAALDRASFERFEELGSEMTPVELPAMPYDAMMIILSAEAAAVFDEFTRNGGPDQMVRQEAQAWPNVLRASRTIPAVDYLNANRLRTLAMQQWRELFDQVDVILTPTGAADQLPATNLTGHPALIMPNGFRSDGTPGSITLLGGYFREDLLLGLGHRFQEATDFHLKHPSLDQHLG